MKIRDAYIEDCGTIATLVATANRAVALRFGLNAENCPKHASFCSPDWIKADFDRGVRYYILEKDDRPVGCVAYERPEPGLAYLNRLAVLPDQQRQGIGELLVRHIIQLAGEESVEAISIGVIGEHVDLIRWYEKFDFHVQDTKQYSHLPFSVVYMAYQVGGL